MSLPINRKALNRLLLDSLSQVYQESPNEFLKSLLADPATESVITSIPPRSNGSFSNYTVEYVPNEYMTRAEMEYRREKDRAELIKLQQMYAPVPDETFPFASELRKQVMDTMESAVTSALSGGSTAPAPSRSSTDHSNLSGASLMTSFLSRKSAANSKSSPDTSRSGLPKLLSSPSKAIATKNSTRS